MKTNARNEMSRFGFCQDQEPHPIFHRLARLRNTVAPSRRVEREIEQVEREIEQSMDDAEREYATASRFGANAGAIAIDALS